MREAQRDVFKVLALGLTGVVLIKLAQNSGGVARIIEALGNTYTTTVGTLAKA